MSPTLPLSPLDVPPRRRGAEGAIALLVAVAVHAAVAALAALAPAADRPAPTPAQVTELMEVEFPQAPAPPPAPSATALPEAPVARARVEKPSLAAPPPAAAQAGAALTALEEEVVDFGDTLVAGEGQSYAGGVTEKGGTSTTSVRDANARAGGVEGGTGTDLSRAPQLAGAAKWDCPFPPEADDAGLDEARVGLRVSVSADGTVTGAQVTDDPGHGFGREARRCALRKRWQPAQDRAGRPVDADAVVRVLFER